MRRLLVQAAPVLKLTRVTTAFAAVADLWFVILWTRATPQEPGVAALGTRPLWVLLAGGAATAVGLYAFGVSLNDLLDARRDRTIRPDRPLASGAVSMEAALSIVAGTLLLAVLGASTFGTDAVVMTVILAGAILVFNAAARFVPGVGLVLLGLIYAGHMLVPNVDLRFLWPVWLVMTHALVVYGVGYWLARKVPPISRRAVVASVLGWAFWSIVLATIQWTRRGNERDLWLDWVPPAAMLWPALLAVAYAVFAIRRVRSVGIGPRAAEKITRYGSMWLTLYACAWMFAAGHTRGGWILAGLAAVGFVCMTVLREWYGLLEHPVGYRRAEAPHRDGPSG